MLPNCSVYGRKCLDVMIAIHRGDFGCNVADNDHAWFSASREPSRVDESIANVDSTIA